MEDVWNVRVASEAGMPFNLVPRCCRTLWHRVYFPGQERDSSNSFVFNMAYPRYPSISLLRALKFSCESFGSHSPSGANTASKLVCKHPRRESVRLLSHCQKRIQTREDSSFFNRPRPNHAPISHQASFLRRPLRGFSTTSSLRAFKTVQEAKSRHGLGVLQIPLGQALFRGACLVISLTDVLTAALDTQSRRAFRRYRFRHHHVFPRRKSTIGTQANCGADQGDWKAKSRRTLQACGSQWESVYG